MTNKKKTIMMCVVSPEQRAGVVETYALAGTYAFEYLEAAAAENPVLSKTYEFETKDFLYGMLEEDAADAAVKSRAEAACFSVSLKNEARAMSLARQMKLAAPQLKIIAGGPQAFAPERLLRKYPHLDYVVSGEGEETFVELLEAMAAGRPLDGVKGLAWRDGGRIAVSANRPPKEDLGRHPRAISRKKAAELSDVVLYETSRGCRYSCAYCLWSPYPKRYFPMRRIKEELGWILANPKVKRIWFVDSDFDSDPERAKEILRYVRDNNPHGTKVSGFLSFDRLDEELLGLVAELFIEIPVGIQTVDAGLQKALGRAWFDPGALGRKLETICRSIEPERLFIDLMFALPGERRGDLMRSLRWCVSRGLPHINFFRLGIYPGTPLAATAKRRGMVCDPEPPHLVYGTGEMSYADIVEIEEAVINYKILLGIAGAAGVMRLEKEGLLEGALKGLRAHRAGWEGVFVQVDETNIAYLDTAAAAQLAAKAARAGTIPAKAGRIIAAGAE